MKIGLLTLVVGEEYRKNVYYGLRSKEEYCARHDIDFIVDDHNYLPRHPIPWSKLAALQKHLDGYDLIFLSDADVLITNLSFDLSRMLDLFLPSDKDLLINSELNFTPSGDIGNSILNSGNFFIRNTSWARSFLDHWISLDQYRDAEFWEQSALNSGLLRHDGHVQLCYNQRLFNSFATSYFNGWQPGDFLIHAARWNGPTMMALFQYLYKFRNTSQAGGHPAVGGTILVDSGVSLMLDEFGLLVDASGNPRGEWFSVDPLSFTLHPSIRRRRAQSENYVNKDVVSNPEQAVMARLDDEFCWWAYDFSSAS